MTRPSEAKAKAGSEKTPRHEERIPWWKRFNLPHPKGTKANKADLIPLEGFEVYTPEQVQFAQQYLGLFLEPQLVHVHETSREDKQGTRRFNRIAGCERHQKVTPRTRLDAIYATGNWPKFAAAIKADSSLLRVFTDSCPGTSRLEPVLGVAAEWVSEQFNTPLGKTMTAVPDWQEGREGDTEDCGLCAIAWHSDGTVNKDGYTNRTFGNFVRGGKMNQYYTVLVPSITDWTGTTYENTLWLLEIKPAEQVKFEALSDDVGEDEDEDWPKRGHKTLQRVRFTASRDPGPTTSSVLGNWTAKKILTWDQIQKMNPDAVIAVNAESVRARLADNDGYYMTVALFNDPSATAEGIIEKAVDIFAGHDYLPNGCDFARVLRPSSREQLAKELKYPMDKYAALVGAAPEQEEGAPAPEPQPEAPPVSYSDADIPF